jgi:hypothetical protein
MLPSLTGARSSANEGRMLSPGSGTRASWRRRIGVCADSSRMRDWSVTSQRRGGRIKLQLICVPTQHAALHGRFLPASCSCTRRQLPLDRAARDDRLGFLVSACVPAFIEPSASAGSAVSGGFACAPSVATLYFALPRRSVQTSTSNGRRPMHGGQGGCHVQSECVF